VSVDGNSPFIRDPRRSDQAYVASTWRSSLLCCDRRITRGDANRLVDRYLDLPGTRILIASDSKVSDAIWGWIAYWQGEKATRGPRVLHYLYVREPKRRAGYATELVRRAWPGNDGPIIWSLEGPDAYWLVSKYKNAVRISEEEVFK